MNVTIEEKGSCVKIFKVDVPYSEMDGDFSRMKQRLQQNAVIPGFRAGKAPWSVIEKHYGDSIDGEVIREVIQSNYMKALEENKINPTKQPEVQNVDYKKGEKLTFDIEIEYYPEVELPKYTGIKIEKTKVEISDTDVDNELKVLQEQRVQFEAIEDRASKMGDFLIIDYQIKQKDEVVDEAKQIWVEMKKDFFIPEFCENLTGMKKDEEKDIKVTLPKTYPKQELQNKKVVISVKLSEIKKKVLPEIDDNLAKEIGNFKNLSELKDEMRKQIELHAQENVKKDMIKQIEDYLIANTNFDVPESIASNYQNALYEDTKSYLKSLGPKSEDYLKEKDTELKEKTRKDAIDQIKVVFSFRKIAEKEDLVMKDEDVDKHIEEIAKKYNKKPDEIRSNLKKSKKMSSLENNLQREKVVNFLIEKADIKEVDKKKKEG